MSGKELPTSLSYAFGRLFTRLKVMSGGAVGPVSLSSVILPVTDVDAVLQIHGVRTANSATMPIGSTADTVPLVVPAGKRWRVWAVWVNRSSGDNTGSIIANDASAGLNILLESGAAAASKVLAPAGGFVLEPGDGLGYTLAGAGVAASVFLVRALISEEDAY